MKNKSILNYVFVLGILVLLVNDHLLKSLYGNWFTGKLSDFAGLIVFPMFLKFAFSLSNRKAILLTVIGFIFWKSPLSQPLIDGVNAISTFHISRVVDYTDFITFLTIPFTFYVLNNIQQYEIRAKINKKKVTTALMLISIASFIATSQDDDVFPEPLSEHNVINQSVHKVSMHRYYDTIPVVDDLALNDTLSFQHIGSSWAFSQLDSVVIVYDDSISISHLHFMRVYKDSLRNILDARSWKEEFIDEFYRKYDYVFTDYDYEEANKIQ